MKGRKIEKAKEGMELQIRCRDVGVDSDYVAHGRTGEELFKNAAAHGKSAHDMEQIPPEIVEKIRSAILCPRCLKKLYGITSPADKRISGSMPERTQK